MIENSKAWGTAVADYNNDGKDDIYITGHDADDRIWYWTSKGYKPSTQGFELPGHPDRHDCAPADVNQDGRMDIYCAIGAGKGSGSADKELWIQFSPGRFSQVGLTLDFGAKDPYGRGRRPIFFDFNKDGFPDLFTTNMGVPREDGMPNINRIYLNQSGESFSEVITTATGLFGSACIAKGDINADGWDDIVVCSDTGPAHLYVNNQQNDFIQITPPGPLSASGRPPSRQRFAEPILPQDLVEGLWADAKLSDMDGDGKDDLLIITRFTNRLQIWKNSGTAPYFESLIVDDELPNTGVSLAIGDFNRDGLKDLYVVLADPSCETSGRDSAPDLHYEGVALGAWTTTRLTQDFAGCGHMADVLDGDKVLLLNGGGGWPGPNFVLEFARSKRQ